ncbi:MAG: phenylacetate-CoA ligase [Frankiaceae bacterium]|nr:phenylacetate-CoA ligase [Frankiaceae bacterium]
MPTWDHKSPAALRKQRDALVLTQLRDAVAPFSPFWRERFQALGLKPSTISQKDFARLPAVGERDVCPDGDPASAARLVLQATEVGYALHVEGPALRRALVKRLTSSTGYRAQVEADSRPTSYAWTGHAVRFPVASTRSDLDVIARAGARLWKVIGLTPADIVLDATALEPTPQRTALDLAAIAGGTPTFRTGTGSADVLAAARLVRITALVTTPTAVADLLRELAAGGADLSALSTLVLLGAPSADDRRAAVQALGVAGASSEAVVVAVYAPSGARVLWGECRESARAGRPTGFHTYPDLDLLEVVDPDTADPVSGAAGGELVLTQLGLRGSALVRWRTGDLVDSGVDATPCPSCGRVVPRVPSGVRSGALVRPYLPRGGRAGHVDLRSVSAALAGRGDLRDWRVVLRKGRRDGADELLVHIVPAGEADPAEVSVGVARDVRLAAGLLPSQVVVSEQSELPAPAEDGLGKRIVDRR